MNVDCQNRNLHKIVVILVVDLNLYDENKRDVGNSNVKTEHKMDQDYGTFQKE